MKELTRQIVIIFSLIITLFLVGCNQVTCDEPYIKVGTSCCLDQNDNNICDSDEERVKPGTPNVNQEVEHQEQTFTINDLQADIGNVLGETVFLTKDQKLDHALVYSNKVQGSKFLGTYGLNLFYYKPTTQKPQIIIEITEPEHYIKNKEDFRNFISVTKNIFLETALNSKVLFENEFKEGELPNIIYLVSGVDKYTSKKAKYVSHSESPPVSFYDDIYYPEAVSGNIAEIKYVKINRYVVNISDTDRLERNPKPKYTRELSNINYGQSAVVQCSPNLLIALSVEDYGAQSKTYEKNYNRKDLTKDFFSTPINSYYRELVTDAQALLKMCEQRYQFTYIRGR